MDLREIEYYDDKVILKDAANFNIKQTFECGQCFRWKKQENGNYIGIAHGRVLELEQSYKDIIIYNTNKQDFQKLWMEYFDLERNYADIKNELSKDEILKKSVEYGYGIRILKQEPFEILISFIISARNSIPVISKTIDKISRKFGTEIKYKENTYYTFPTIEKLKDATVDDIRETGASFRSKYIVDTINKIYECNRILKNTNNYNEAKDLSKEDKYDILDYDLNKISLMGDDDCHKELQKFMGVGSKVADCVMLFSMKKYSAFPVDVWVKRAMEHFYLAPDMSLNKIRIFGRNTFGNLSGFAQQYLFYYARENNIKL